MRRPVSKDHRDHEGADPAYRFAALFAVLRFGDILDESLWVAKHRLGLCKRDTVLLFVGRILDGVPCKLKLHACPMPMLLGASSIGNMCQESPTDWIGQGVGLDLFFGHGQDALPIGVVLHRSSRPIRQDLNYRPIRK